MWSFSPASFHIWIAKHWHFIQHCFHQSGPKLTCISSDFLTFIFNVFSIASVINKSREVFQEIAAPPHITKQQYAYQCIKMQHTQWFVSELLCKEGTNTCISHCNYSSRHTKLALYISASIPQNSTCSKWPQWHLENSRGEFLLQLYPTVYHKIIVPSFRHKTTAC